MNISEKLNNLPIELQNYFCSSQPRIVLEKSCFLYEIFEDDISKLTPVIGSVFLGEQFLNKLPIHVERNLHVNTRISHGIAYEINKNMFCKFQDYFQDAEKLLKEWETLKAQPLLSEEKAWRRVLDIEPWLEAEEKEKEKEAQNEAEEKEKAMDRLEKLPLLQALIKYPKLGDQNVTVNMLKLQSFESLVKPSIKNWITEYRDFNGPGRHNTMERGNFIFHNDNAKRLTPPERQKLTVVLRSLDEDIPVFIDGELQQVVFIEEDPGNNMQQGLKSKPVNVDRPSASTQPQMRIEKRSSQAPAQSSPANTQSASRPQVSKEYNVAPFGKTINLADMSHLQNLPIKQAPQSPREVASDIKQNVIPQKAQAMPQDRESKVEQYFSAQKTTEQPRRDFQRASDQNVQLPKKTFSSNAYDPSLYAPDNLPTGANAVQKSARPNQVQPDYSNQTAQNSPKYPMPMVEPLMLPTTPGQQRSSLQQTREVGDDGKGKISFSSPQRMSSERNAKIKPRNPFRIRPHGFSQEDYSDPNKISPSDLQGLI